MKANAPEKIYLFENPITETPDNRWLSKRSGDTDIEYTRTDAFIEKVYRFLAPYIHDSRGDGQDRDYIYEKFKKYMKGE